ncbi:predicted protein [Postia placenta Mad-698-R]|nr:predicted protein [Postia placenta Mad-698-R]
MAHSRTHSVDTEMHELNQEADYLEEKTHIVPGPNGSDAKLQRHDSDPDAQAMVVASLRSQIQDLFSQVSQLNSKLVSSYDRVSDLEDELHVTSANLRSTTLKVSELELERSQHLSALSTGLLVEKDHVTTELNRLMEKATEEAAQRGQAESARAEIEKDLDDLSANLFNQANNMVAEARIAQARSERKAEETERALRQAEEVVGLLQEQMQALQGEKERAGRAVEEMRITMGKGKWVDRPHEAMQSSRPRLLSSHAPYQEYLMFISHLRTIRPASQHPPAMSTLLPLPFLARLVTEDSDPTVRLDLAPSLNWLSRRSVISAIHSGQLTVEPMSTPILLEELAPSTIPGAHHTQISCALCGTSIISPPQSDSPTAVAFPSTGGPVRPHGNNSWSSSLFKNSIVQTISAANHGVLTHSRSQSPAPPITSEPPAQVYIFRVAATSSGLPVSLPLSSQQTSAQNRPTIYPLCTSKWCLARLRTTCSMWAFVRTSMIEKVWEESPYVAPVRPSPAGTINGINGLDKHDAVNGVSEADRKPTVPPRRARMAIGALWGSVSRSLSGSGKELEAELPKAVPEKPLPKSPTTSLLPPPVHPSLSAPARTSTVPQTPPPLPKRNRGRDTKSKTIASPGEDADPNPTLDRKASQDVFTTPAEEPAAFDDLRAPSPTSVPLPPSSPPSPEPHASVQPPSTTHHMQEGTGSSRNGSPAPPPLPRRAAARPRPVSVIVPQEPAAPSETEIKQPESVVNEPKETDDNLSVSGQVGEQAVTTLRAEAKGTNDAPQESEAPAAEAADVAVHEEPAAPESQSVELASHEQEEEQSSVETKQEVPSATDAVPETAETTKIDEVLIEDADSSRSLLDTSSLNGLVDGVEGQSVQDRKNAADAIGLTDHQPAADAQAELLSGVHDELTDTPAEEPGLYVGDATWEERAWKELIKLREEMFWARIGGVR